MYNIALHTFTFIYIYIIKYSFIHRTSLSCFFFLVDSFKLHMHRWIYEPLLASRMKIECHAKIAIFNHQSNDVWNKIGEKIITYFFFLKIHSMGERESDQKKNFAKKSRGLCVNLYRKNAEVEKCLINCCIRCRNPLLKW